MHAARRSKLTVPETLARLRDAGLDSIPGGGAEILVDRVREIIAPKKVKTKEWLGVMREAHRLGISTTATMMYGHVETLDERVEHLRRIRELQDETGGFRAFFSWTFQDDGNRLVSLVPAEARPTSFDYLLTQAVSRIYLDNVPHIGSSWVTQGKKIGQVALGFGADDLGSVMIEENVVSAAGTTHRDERRGARPPDPLARQDGGAAGHALPRRQGLDLTPGSAKSSALRPKRDRACCRACLRRRRMRGRASPIRPGAREHAAHGRAARQRPGRQCPAPPVSQPGPEAGEPAAHERPAAPSAAP